MKKSNLLFAIVLVTGFAFSSCKKAVNNQNSGTATVTATVDGAAWTSSADGPHSPVGAVGAVNTSQNIIIQAYGADGSYMSLNTISASSALVAGQAYVSSNGEFQAQYKSSFTGSDSWSSILGSGTLTFSIISNSKIAGTFSFEGVHPGNSSTTSVTSGSFTIDL